MSEIKNMVLSIIELLEADEYYSCSDIAKRLDIPDNMVNKVVMSRFNRAIKGFPREQIQLSFGF
tara:strand:- start:1996 stop:2187 length:192 start_codon:yes stop_codon:yes gene_type:complete